MTGTRDPFEYDVAVSYAKADQAAAEELVRGLQEKDLTVFRDEYISGDATRWGEQMLDHVVNLYDRKARYCVLLISRHYPLERWTEAERRSAEERSLRDADEYILLVQLDDADVPGLDKAPGYQDLRRGAMGEVVERLAASVRQDTARRGPPGQSHDLRSGNIPSGEEQDPQF